jgi:hypothetical protein
MPGVAIDELMTAAADQIPDLVAAVNAARGKAIAPPASYQDWWKEEAELDRKKYPVLAILFERGALRRAKVVSGVRDEKHTVDVKWVCSGKLAEIGAQLLYVPEVLARWFDVIPTKTTDATKVIWKIGGEQGGQDDDIPLAHDLEYVRSDGTCLWAVTATITVHTRM